MIQKIYNFFLHSLVTLQIISLFFILFRVNNFYFTSNTEFDIEKEDARPQPHEN